MSILDPISDFVTGTLGAPVRYVAGIVDALGLDKLAAEFLDSMIGKAILAAVAAVATGGAGIAIIGPALATMSYAIPSIVGNPTFAQDWLAAAKAYTNGKEALGIPGASEAIGADAVLAMQAMQSEMLSPDQQEAMQNMSQEVSWLQNPLHVVPEGFAVPFSPGWSPAGHTLKFGAADIQLGESGWSYAQARDILEKNGLDNYVATRLLQILAATPRISESPEAWAARDHSVIPPAWRRKVDRGEMSVDDLHVLNDNTVIHAAAGGDILRGIPANTLRPDAVALAMAVMNGTPLTSMKEYDPATGRKRAGTFASLGKGVASGVSKHVDTLYANSTNARAGTFATAVASNALEERSTAREIAPVVTSVAAAVVASSVFGLALAPVAGIGLATFGLTQWLLKKKG